MVAVIKSQLLLVDDHPLFRAGLAITLGGEPDLEVVGEASTGSEAVELVRDMAVDIAVIDVLLPTASGVSLAAELHAIRPSCKILGLSVLDEPAIIATMLRAGASGYALKTQDPAEITSAIRTVLAGSSYLPPLVSSRNVFALVQDKAQPPLERLTPREREVFELLIHGHSNDEIAAQLFIARRTVETHRHRIMKKLAAHSMLEMVRLAAREGALTD
jgi:DNA-binding NarL/FixJ family response regulator